MADEVNNSTNVNEAYFSRMYLMNHPTVYTQDMFFTPEGMMRDELPMKREVYRMIEPYVTSAIPRKIGNIVDLLRMHAYAADFPPEEDCIHLMNGTLCPDGRFEERKNRVVRSRLPMKYDPDAPAPTTWLRYLSDLLYPEDIPTFQEYVGYCLLPSNKGQKMMVIKGSGGEGKSQIGTVLKKLFGDYCKDGSVAKISENRFARADLEHVHLMIDDDMRMDALRQTNYVKSIVTAKGRMDLEKKGKQSYQGYLYARLLAFSNGDLQSLYDRSDGFFRRQLILTAKPKDPHRVDDPDLGAKMCRELPGILLWAFEGLKRLHKNRYRFTESERAARSREVLKQDTTNAILFMQAGDYVRADPSSQVTSKDLYAAYCLWCEENSVLPLRARSFSEYLMTNASDYGIEHVNNVCNAQGRRVRGFRGIRILTGGGRHSPQRYEDDDCPFSDWP